MPIRITCPSCKRTGRVPDNAIGRTIMCPVCEHRYVLTAEKSVPDDLELLNDEPVHRPRSKAKVNSWQDDQDVGQSKTFPSKREHPGRSTNTILWAAVGAAAVLVMLLAVGTGVAVVRFVSVEAPAQPTIAAPALTPVAGQEFAKPTMTPRAPGSDLAAEAEAPRIGTAPASGDDGAGAGKSLSTAEIVEESEPSIALIKGKTSSGTGFLVGPGLLATNAHVVDDEFVSSLEVRFPSADDAHRGPLPVELLFKDRRRDLAFLGVKTDLPALRIASSYKFRKGEDVTVIGNPGVGADLILENAISRGVMSTKATIEGQNFYQLGITINPGNSGGPVFNSSGRVIGVATLKTAKQEALAFSIPVEDLREALDRLAAQSSDDRDRLCSRHRSVCLVKGLGSGGALYCMAMDLRRAVASASNDPKLIEAKTVFEQLVTQLDKTLFPTFRPELPDFQNDPDVVEPVRSKVVELADNFTKLQASYNQGGNGDLNLNPLKQTHRRLIVELSKALNLEEPKQMLVAFDDHSRAGVVAVPTILSGTGPGSAGSLNQWMLDRRRSAMKPPTVTPPSNRPGMRGRAGAGAGSPLRNGPR